MRANEKGKCLEKCVTFIRRENKVCVLKVLQCGSVLKTYFVIEDKEGQKLPNFSVDSPIRWGYNKK